MLYEVITTINIPRVLSCLPKSLISNTTNRLLKSISVCCEKTSREPVTYNSIAIAILAARNNFV